MTVLQLLLARVEAGLLVETLLASPAGGTLKMAILRRNTRVLMLAYRVRP